MAPATGAADASAVEGSALTISVVIVTWNRPGHVAGCLRHLRAQDEPVHQIVVVDASPDDATREVCTAYDGVAHVRFPGGAGHMTRARNEGLLHVTGRIVAFLDDDAYPAPPWSAALAECFRTTGAAAVCGRTLNGQPGEAADGVDRIGLLLPDGTLTGHFAADPGRPVPIDHGIGANMAFRSDVLAELGGLRDDFPGTALREDSDVFLRLRRLGLAAYFCPPAVVHHVGAPHVVGRRFDRRYQFWARHNHVRLLSRHTGLRDRLTRRWLAGQVARDTAAARAAVGRTPVRAVARFLWSLAAVGSGVGWAIAHGHWSPASPCRDDAAGRRIAAQLLPRTGITR